MALNIKAGDIIKVDQTYAKGVLGSVHNPGPTHFQMLQSLYILRDETAKILSIGQTTIEGVIYTFVHLTPTNLSNTLLRGGKGTNIYFVCEDYVNKALLKA